MLRGWIGRGIGRLRSSWWRARLIVDAWVAGGRLALAPTVRLRVRVMFKGAGSVAIGAHATLGDRDAGLPGAPILLNSRHRESVVSIGRDTRLANGVELTALERIGVGEGCLIGAGGRMIDGDFHGVAPGERSWEGAKAGVEIGDHVWIGMGVMVLKGVRIGNEAVIGAGSVVTKDVPAGAVAAGNPAMAMSHRVAAR
jgi:acetyltransferase-like isoleucine patch superfamily enzyme